MYSTLIRCWLPCLVFLPFLSFGQGAGKKLASFKLPSTNSSGLVDIYIEYDPVFRIDQIGNTASVLLNMNVVLSRATAIKGNFWYRYWYEGEQYTDLQLGRDVFVPIDLENMSLSLTLMGPDALIKTIQWDRSMQNQIVVKVQGKPKASDFTVFIKGLDYVAFRGEEAIKRAINDLKAAQRKKLDDEKKKEVEKLAVEKRAADDRKANQATGQNQTDPPHNSSDTLSTASSKNNPNSDDGFWTEKKPAPAASNNSHLPDLAMSTDGKYYQKGNDGKYRQIGYDEYQSLKREKAQQKTAANTIDPAVKREADRKALDATMAQIKQDQARDEAMWKDIDRKIELRQQGYAAVGQMKEARENLNQTATLSGGYASVEQLMADFNQRMSQVNSAVNDLTAKKNAAWNASVDANFNGPNDGAYADGLKAIGGLVNSIKEDKERKRAQQELIAQKEAMKRQMEAEEKRLLTGIRTDLFKRFREGSLPLSSSKLEANTLYFFTYAYDPAQLGAKNPILYISNVFPVNRYSDGTWPFKNSITNDIAKLTPYQEVLHGYYISQQEADAMQRGLKDMFTKSGGSIAAVVYKGKKTASASTGGTTDFWETGRKTLPDSTSKEKKPVKKDDFWSN